MLADTQCRNAKSKDKPYKPTGVKAWRYRFKLVKDGTRKESVFAIGDYVRIPARETLEESQACKAGGGLTLAEARDERIKARDMAVATFRADTDPVYPVRKALPKSKTQH